MDNEMAKKLQAEGLTLEAIGARLGGITKQRVSQLLNPERTRRQRAAWRRKNPGYYNAYLKARRARIQESGTASKAPPHVARPLPPLEAAPEVLS